MPRCEKCGDYYWNDGDHDCPPAWLVWCPDAGETVDGARTVYAYDPSTAATKWAQVEDYEAGEMLIGNDGQAVAMVKLKDSPEAARRYVVTGECVPTYSAENIEVRDA